jgi:CubicO group peptidase (beta-lactamase class C family)
MAAGLAVAVVGTAACSSSGASIEASPPSTASTSGPAGSRAGTSSGSTSGASATVFPGAEWDTVDPAVAGMDAARLEAMAEQARSAGSNCLVVTRHGKLVKEWYWNGKSPDSTQEVFSATKSYASALVGIAQAEGKLDIDEPASKYITEWQGTPSEPVTIKNLLSNDSGRYYNAATDYVEMAVGAPDKTAFAVGLTQQHPVGTHWDYNNSAIQTLSRVLEVATGQEAADYAEEKLLGPIGMADSTMKKDSSGGTLTFMGLDSTCRDMARFGHLFLQEGSWSGTQVVPSDYVDESTSPSQSLNPSYGYLWWLNTKGRGAAQATGAGAGDGDQERQLAPGAPENAFFALGLGNQHIAVLPDSGVVAVRLGPVNTPGATQTFPPQVIAEMTQAAVSGPPGG